MNIRLNRDRVIYGHIPAQHYLHKFKKMITHLEQKINSGLLCVIHSKEFQFDSVFHPLEPAKIVIK